jgi:catechol 2,3-dioxygenase-like lactoylglutathione lyase family enzyme
MLGNYAAVPTLATSNLAASRHFYETVLGFEAVEVDNEGVLYATGSGHLLVYPSAYAGTNKATYVSFQIPQHRFDEEILELKARGVALDTFDYEDAVWEGGVLTRGDLRGAWFKDPDGNTISVETHPRIT